MENRSGSAWKLSLPVVIAIAFMASLGAIFLATSLTTGECLRLWNADAVAWIDTNLNGSVDSGEQMLPDIRIHADDVYDRYKEAHPSFTDPAGIAHITIIADACPNPELNIYPDIPAGYRLTTAHTIHVKENFFGNIEYNKTYYFGFAKIP
jgi:hypothetical protein